MPKDGSTTDGNFRYADELDISERSSAKSVATERFEDRGQGNTNDKKGQGTVAG